MLQMVHPDRVVAEADLAKLPLVEPVYPLTEGLSLNQVRKAADAALARAARSAGMAGPAPGSRASASRRSPRRCGTCTGRPSRPTSLPEGPAWSRLAYDEFLAGQLALALVRAHLRRPAGRATPGTGHLRKKLIEALPYSLTPSQTRAVAEIVADLAKPERMLRLLQGDVGSGKTVVALLAAAAVIEGGRQAALMAPTEILARQHFNTIAPLAAAAGIKVAILTGRERGRERSERARKARLRRHPPADRHPCAVPGGGRVPRPRARGGRRAAPLRRAPAPRAGQEGRGGRRAGDDRDADPAHAGADLFRRHGRLRAARKAGRPPADRHPHRAAVAARRRWSTRSAARSPRAGASTGSARWSRTSENTDLAAAEERFAALKERFGAMVDLVHGRMKGADKDRAMERFAAGETRLLVATTVIEVGVDVPEATVMVIEHAERFGLAQLHQLRGRIGRGAGRSTCLLLYKAPLGETAKARLAIMRETEDGFRIAEEDLRLRGEGDVLGTRQSGMPGFRIARIEVHGKLIGAARDDAALMLARDPDARLAARRRRCGTCSICSSATRRSGSSGRDRCRSIGRARPQGIRPEAVGPHACPACSSRSEG